MYLVIVVSVIPQILQIAETVYRALNTTTENI